MKEKERTEREKNYYNFTSCVAQLQAPFPLNNTSRASPVRGSGGGTHLHA